MVSAYGMLHLVYFDINTFTQLSSEATSIAEALSDNGLVQGKSTVSETFLAMRRSQKNS